MYKPTFICLDFIQILKLFNPINIAKVVYSQEKDHPFDKPFFFFFLECMAVKLC